MTYRRAGAAIGLAMAFFAFDDVQAQEAAAAAVSETPALEPQDDADPDVSGGAVVSYPASFFAEFRPNSVNDMIGHVPGFTFNEGDNVRGFGGAAGNVLINGQRPSSKTVELGDLLGRIPASLVERIDVIRGGAPGIDMQGQPVVANVIRKAGASATRAVQTLIKPYTDGYVGVKPRIEQSISTGSLQVDSYLGASFDRRQESGDGVLTRRGPSGSLIESGEYDNDTREAQYDGSVAAAYQRRNDIFRLNGAFGREDVDRRELGALTDLVAGAPFQQISRTKEREDTAEIGGDYDRDLNDWLGLQLIGLKGVEKEKQSTFKAAPGGVETAYQTLSSGESILRGVLTARASQSLRFEGGAEGAFNYLDAASRLAVDGVPVDLPSDTVRIEERRAETFATATWRPTERISTEAGLRWEVSTIQQSGGASLKKTFSFPKPRLIASYDLDSNSQIRVRFERTVGQLDFEDFAATTEADAGTVNVGNPNLVPERAWVMEAALERRFWGSGAVVLTLTHYELQQVLDLIPVAGRYDAPGNIGDGTKDEAKLSLTVPLDKLGVSGGVVRFNGTWRRSSVTDPVTGLSRGISDLRPFEGDLYVGKSLPGLNSTVAVEADFGWSETSYRIDEVRKTVDKPLWKLYWDWNARPDLVFRFQVENFTAKKRLRYRTVFDGPRSLRNVSFKEFRSAELGPFLMIRVRKTFS